MTTVLITGANKGIGFETASQLTELGHTVWIGARDAERGKTAAAAIGAKWIQLDVTGDDSIASAMDTLVDAVGLDVIVNNAGIPPHEPFGDDWFDVFNTNTLGSFGIVTDPEKTQSTFASGIYGTSKAAVAMLTLQYSMAEPTIKFSAVEPGYTNTDFNAAMPGGRSVTESARGVVERVLLGTDGPTGTLVEDGETIPW